MKKRSLFVGFRFGQRTFQCFFRSKCDGKQEPSAFNPSLSADFMIGFADLQNQRSRFDRILSFDRLRTRMSKRTIMVHEGRCKCHGDTSKLILSQG